MSSSTADAPEVARQRLASALIRALKEEPPQRTRLMRVETEVDLRPLPWLLAQKNGARYYWQDRAGLFEMAGAEDADVLLPSGPRDLEALFTQARKMLSIEFPSLRYYGGFRFYNLPNRGPRWKNFAQYRFIVPRFEVIRRGKRTFLACNFKAGSAQANERTLTELLAALEKLSLTEHEGEPELPKTGDRTDLPSFAGWTDLVQRALAAIHATPLEKVVLAREVSYTAEEDFDAMALLARLQEQTEHAFEFCFEPVPRRAFLGASPERLFKRTNCLLETEAVAGTRPRGKTDAGDRALGDELLHSEKDLREHRFVVQMLEQDLAPFCRHLETEPEPELMRLRHCQHLYTRIEAIVDDNECDAALVDALHPTPAVGGSPGDVALEWLTENEPFDRGVYAAPVGWVGYDASEFCVAIRSGLMRDNELTLYTGAGIVPGSTPENEWDEIENKMANFLHVLGHGPQ